MEHNEESTGDGSSGRVKIQTSVLIDLWRGMGDGGVQPVCLLWLSFQNLKGIVML